MDKIVEQAKCRVYYHAKAISKAMTEMKFSARVYICANYKNAECICPAPGSSAIVPDSKAT